MLEVINDGLECNETLNTSDELDHMDTTKETVVKEERDESAAEITAKDKKGKLPNSLMVF